MSTHINFVEKVEKAAMSISGYTELFAESITIDIEYNGSLSFIWGLLEKLGITKDNEESHSLIANGFCKEGDARAVFCEGDPPVIPVPWFRKIWAILSDAKTAQTKEDGTATKLINYLDGNRPVTQWSDKTLIEAYSPDCSSEILDDFKRRANGKAVVAFENESAGTVNVEITLELLRQSRRRSIPKIYKKDGKVYRLYAVGDHPSEIYEESPLSPGTLLYENYCDSCGMDFTGVSKEAKQFLRVAYNEGVTPKKSDRMAMIGIVAAAKTGLEELKKFFPEVGIIYDELAKTDELPSLKSITSHHKQLKWDQVKSDPFGSGNKRF